VERPQREHFLLEVLEDDPIHARAELRGRLAVAGVVREPAPRGLELARVEDELAGGPGPARLRARGRLRVLVSRFALVGWGADFQDLGARAEARNALERRLGPSGATTLVSAVVGRVLAEVGGVRFGGAEIHDVPNFWIAGDLEPASAGTLSRPSRARDGSEARSGGFGRLNGFLALDALLHRTSLAKAGTGDADVGTNRQSQLVLAVPRYSTAGEASSTRYLAFLRQKKPDTPFRGGVLDFDMAVTHPALTDHSSSVDFSLNPLPVLQADSKSRSRPEFLIGTRKQTRGRAGLTSRLRRSVHGEADSGGTTVWISQNLSRRFTHHRDIAQYRSGLARTPTFYPSGQRGAACSEPVGEDTRLTPQYAVRPSASDLASPPSS
jgi:hypothetical protein